MTPLPPPTIAALVAVWCGAQNGGSVSSGLPAGRVPATEWIAVTSSAASGSSRGSTVGSRSASMVLPTPGGPSSSRWWPPAAQISAARRAVGWPTTSARSRPRASPARRRRASAAATGPAVRPGPWARRPGRDLTAGGAGRAVTSGRGRAGLAAQPGQQRAQAGRGHDPHARHQGRLGRVLRGHGDAPEPARRRGGHRGQHAANRAQPAVEPQLAEEHQAADAGPAGRRRRRPGSRPRCRGRSCCRAWAGWPATGRR